MTLPKPLMDSINILFFPSLVKPGVFRLSHEHLNVYYDIRSWLEKFHETLQARKWKRAAHELCMLGVDSPDRVLGKDEFKWAPLDDPTLMWLEQNQDRYNELVAQVLSDYKLHGAGLDSILLYVRADIGRHKAGEEPEIFGTLSYAEWIENWLKQV